jgi:lipooligosaccharide transport system permease protein
MDQVNIPVFLLIIPMFTFCGTYFPRNTLPPLLKTITGFFPLSAFTDLLRWSLGLPSFWVLELLWMVLCTVVFGVLAWRRIYPQLFR